MAKRKKNERVEDEIPDQEIVPARYSITAYGADYPVDSLIKRLRSNDILIPTFDPDVPVDQNHSGFQRQFIWTKTQCDRFIDSLLLGFPVPGIFLAKRADEKLLVLDGQQRLRTLLAFCSGTLRGEPYQLEKVQTRYIGKTYESLDTEDRRRLDDSIIHATIVRQDEPSDDQSSIYLIFERLNTGGTALQPQEIRVALHREGLVSLIRDLNDVASWRKLYGKKSARLKDQELILRFFAMLFWSKNYARPMKDFLNRYLDKNQTFKLQKAEELQAIFTETSKTISLSLGGRALRLEKTINAAVLDSVMVGVASRLIEKKKTPSKARLRAAHAALLRNKSFLEAVTRATADEESVKTRLRLARKAFAKT